MAKITRFFLIRLIVKIRLIYLKTFKPRKIYGAAFVFLSPLILIFKQKLFSIYIKIHIILKEILNVNVSCQKLTISIFSVFFVNELSVQAKKICQLVTAKAV